MVSGGFVFRSCAAYHRRAADFLGVLACRVSLMCSCRLLLHGCAVRPIGAAMSRRASSRRRGCLRCSITAGRSILRLTRAAGRYVARCLALCSPSFGRADLEFLCAPRRRVRRGAFSLRLCALRLISRPLSPAGSSTALRSPLRAGCADAWFYVGPADRLRLRRRQLRHGAGRRCGSIAGPSLLAGCGLRRCCGPSSG